MRILKYILLLLLLLGVAFVVFVATQKSDYTIVRSKEIKISKDIVYNFVTDSTAHVDWNPWKKDIAVFENIKLVTGDTIIQSILVKGEKNESFMRFQNTKKGALVTWKLKGKLDFNLKLLSVLQGGVDNVLGDKLEEGLNNIDSYLVKELTTYNIKINGLVTKHATNYIQQIDTCSFADFHKVSKAMLQNMMAFVDKNDIIITGLPFISYNSWDNKTKTTIFSMCVPVEEEILTTDGSEISGSHFDEFLAIKTTLTGDYSHNKEAWNKTLAYLKKKNLIEDINGAKIEVYKISLPKERKPSKWVTELYVPVKKRIYIAKPKPEVSQEDNTTPSETTTTN
ncbi:GyrI-like domain-containing protein [Flavobacterium sp.]|uniref:GyrI-like domain-containing protein n=1 Tax=Flavobacterium sp. TaxID=239 RepID=UPI0040488DCC